MQGSHRVFIGVAIVWMVWAVGPAAAQHAGDVIAARGDAYARMQGERRALAVGDRVHVGEMIDVLRNGRLKLRMIDGSVISAASETTVTIERYGMAPARSAMLDLTTGLLRIVVAKLEQPSSFEVQTATGVAAVRSTDWFVEASRFTASVTVVSGAVEVRGIGSPAMAAIGPNEVARLRGFPGPSPVLTGREGTPDPGRRRDDVAPVSSTPSVAASNPIPVQTSPALPDVLRRLADLTDVD